MLPLFFHFAPRFCHFFIILLLLCYYFFIYVAPAKFLINAVCALGLLPTGINSHERRFTFRWGAECSGMQHKSDGMETVVVWDVMKASWADVGLSNILDYPYKKGVSMIISQLFTLKTRRHPRNSLFLTTISWVPIHLKCS